MMKLKRLLYVQGVLMNQHNRRQAPRKVCDSLSGWKSAISIRMMWYVGKMHEFAIQRFTCLLSWRNLFSGAFERLCGNDGVAVGWPNLVLWEFMLACRQRRYGKVAGNDGQIQKPPEWSIKYVVFRNIQNASVDTRITKKETPEQPYSVFEAANLW